MINIFAKIKGLERYCFHMKLRYALLLAILLLSIVFVSGCIQQAPAQSVPTQPSTVTPMPESESAQTSQPTQEPTVTAQSEFNFEWSEDSGTRISDGSVPYIYRLKDGRFRLYYCSAGGILSAISSDGLNFEKEAGVRIAPSGGQESMVCDATIVELPDGRIRMYYKGASGQGGPGQALHKVFSAVSQDGLNFEKEGLRIDSESTGDGGWASVPEAIKLPDGRVRIYYVSNDPEAEGGIMSAVSQDGLSFQKEPGARLKGFVDPAVIILPNGKYLLLAVVLPEVAERRGIRVGIYSFISDDGLTFSNQQPVLIDGTLDPSIVPLSRETYRVFYGRLTVINNRPNISIMSITGRLRK